ncbi:conjugative transfer signal peptidase TraF [Bartonella alsatica]|uniref:Conjugative transfer signal peptidase TraF n=2 Tax=Bartonella alsatica TaxID=52764 RepID=J1IX50_9HYPH|nr:conjugative transfer signal peptidase TraF [Bartonella alsatica]EJF76247.1 conjugative transfer signal peptidase TraF [Bartonella alsatica IBS 382]QLC51801.1 conjugative transfer signal peptidase TraF [Bartonella alsatica]
MKQAMAILTLCSLASACFILFALSQGYRINYSRSAPIGIWKVNYFQKKMQRGELMEVCPPDAPIVKEFVEKGYLQSGACPSGSISFLKPLVAIAGDVVSITGKGISVNGHFLKNSQRMRGISGVPNGEYLVAEGYAWFISSFDPVSFDSRYFGAVSVMNIMGKASPILTFKK